MRFLFKIMTLVSGFILITSGIGNKALAQCAMCRATLENNVSNGEIGIAASLNTGILYLFVMPYVVVGFIAYMWYRKSKENEKVQGYPSR